MIVKPHQWATTTCIEVTNRDGWAEFPPGAGSTHTQAGTASGTSASHNPKVPLATRSPLGPGGPGGRRAAAAAPIFTPTGTARAAAPGPGRG